ncbi:hypothetical protein M5K25_013371 [Dendrobium thyrsiflorum]|uniref:Uncharacterized protein n=1 Tax=Dendrobium thyrsiflorum TaxID=117978 RepID=A0ABD0USS0_DENTH
MSPEPIVEDNISQEIILETIDEVPSDSVEENIGLTENDALVDKTKGLEGDIIDTCNHDEDANPIAIRKRKKTSFIWNEFKEIKLANGQKKGECILVIEFAYSMIYGDQSRQNISYVRAILYELFEEYITYFEEKAIEHVIHLE